MRIRNYRRAERIPIERDEYIRMKFVSTEGALSMESERAVPSTTGTQRKMNINIRAYFGRA